MKDRFNSFFTPLSGLTATLLLLTIAPTAFAQSAGDFDTLSGDQPSGDVVQGSGIDFFDLVHAATSAGGVTQSEFNQHQSRKISEAAADFRERQQRALAQEQPATAAPVVEADGLGNP